jgi:hypothetical protein
MQPQLYSGARGKITFKDSDGKSAVLAFVTSVSVSRNDGLRPSYVIGTEGPRSIEPVSVDVSGSIGRIIPVSKMDKNEALDKMTSIDHRFEEKINEILNRNSCEIVIEDKVTGAVLDVIKHVRFAGRNTSVNSGDIASENYQFVGILTGGYGSDENFLADNSTGLNYGKES